MSSHSMANHSYNLVTNFETFDSWSNLYDLSCHISTFSNRKYVQKTGRDGRLPKNLQHVSISKKFSSIDISLNYSLVKKVIPFIYYVCMVIESSVSHEWHKCMFWLSKFTILRLCAILHAFIEGDVTCSYSLKLTQVVELWNP